MFDPQRVPAGAVHPYVLRYTLTSRRFDLTKATSARFVFVRQNGRGVRGEWPATIESARTRTIELVYAFADGDVPAPDEIVFEPRVLTSLGPGELVGATKTLIVFAHPAR